MSLAVYSKDMTLDAALAQNAASIREFNAAAMTFLDLTVTRFTPLNGPASTRYGVEMRSVPYTYLNCDIANGNNSSSVCTASIVTRFRQLSQTEIREQNTLDRWQFWGTIGAYFSVIQTLSWLVSFSWLVDSNQAQQPPAQAHNTAGQLADQTANQPAGQQPEPNEARGLNVIGQAANMRMVRRGYRRIYGQNHDL